MRPKGKSLSGYPERPYLDRLRYGYLRRFPKGEGGTLSKGYWARHGGGGYGSHGVIIEQKERGEYDPNLREDGQNE